MPRSEGFTQYILEEVMGDIPGLSTKPMFGALSLYKDGILFGMIIDDALYFKVDKKSEIEYKESGSTPFLYINKNGKEISMGYYTVPEEIIEDKTALAQWVERAVQAKKNIKSKKK